METRVQELFGIRFGPVSGLSGFGLITAMEINIHEINKINEIEVGLVMSKSSKDYREKDLDPVLDRVLDAMRQLNLNETT